MVSRFLLVFIANYSMPVGFLKWFYHSVEVHWHENVDMSARVHPPILTIIYTNIRPIENLFAAIHPNSRSYCLFYARCTSILFQFVHFSLFCSFSLVILFNSEMCNLSMFHSCTTSQLELCMRRLFFKCNAERNEYMEHFTASIHTYIWFFFLFFSHTDLCLQCNRNHFCHLLPEFSCLYKFKTEQKQIYGLCNNL